MKHALINHSSGNQYVLITSNMYRPSVGGIENSLYHLAVEYKALGYSPIIVTSDINDAGIILPEYEVDEDIEIFRYRACTKKGVIGFLKHINHAIKLYKKILKDYQPLTVVCRYHFNLVLLGLAGCKGVLYLIPSIVKNESKISMQQGQTGLAKIRNNLSFAFHKYLQAKAVKQAKTLYVFSENMRSQVAELTSRADVYITKPGVSLERFYPLTMKEKGLARQELGLVTQRQVLLCVGRLVKVKGFDTAIRAIAGAKKKNMELWLLGDGPLLETFQQLIIELGCQGQVKLLGRQQAPEKYYRAADVFVMSSIHEALGQTILEAMACGLPVIAAPCSENVVTASHEVLDDDKNIFTREHSVEAFAESFMQVAEMSAAEYSIISHFNREKAQERFSWAALAKDLLSERS
ncbi:glycosyltransferase [Colwellia sp. D2M02]|uniref:glycosyltransferase family 4 protein n=1 Tax=Colwellia sp. D2M02 TaxID=2841562 RepID=UPI001C0997B5|nr:glycosyltransferase [Colwellia sp. D2M02]MBU2891919.1 glycosyltransferase [Colwellia sp. D2M02]